MPFPQNKASFFTQLLLTCVSLIACIRTSSAQTVASEAGYSPYKYSVFLEAGGPGRFYSINIQKRLLHLKKLSYFKGSNRAFEVAHDFMFRAGGGFHNFRPSIHAFPFEVIYLQGWHFSHRKILQHFLEVGPGVTLIVNDANSSQGDTGLGTLRLTYGFEIVGGWLFQLSGYGIFRNYLAPFDANFNPWLGLGVGKFFHINKDK